MKEFKINDLITLKLEDIKTVIYIAGERKSVIEVFRVEEPHRNKGIGTLLLKSYANLGYSYTYPSQICFKSSNNRKVIHLFNKFGFSTVPNTDPHCPDFIKMVKNN